MEVASRQHGGGGGDSEIVRIAQIEIRETQTCFVLALS